MDDGPQTTDANSRQVMAKAHIAFGMWQGELNISIQVQERN